MTESRFGPSLVLGSHERSIRMIGHRYLLITLLVLFPPAVVAAAEKEN